MSCSLPSGNVKTSGSDKWYMVENADLGKTAEIEIKGKAATSGDPYVSVSSSMQATTTAAGYLAFNWSLVNGSMLKYDSPHASITLYLDGKELEWDYVWGMGPATSEKQVFVYIPSGKHTLKWVVSGRRAFYCGQECYWDEDQ